MFKFIKKIFSKKDTNVTGKASNEKNKECFNELSEELHSSREQFSIKNKIDEDYEDHYDYEDHFNKSDFKEKEYCKVESSEKKSFKKEGNVIYLNSMDKECEEDYEEEEYEDDEEDNYNENSDYIEKSSLICPECKEKLSGRKSNRNSDGDYYICCSNCNFVSKIINDEKAIRPPNTLKEASKAYNLFSTKPNQFKMNKNDEKQKCNF